MKKDFDWLKENVQKRLDKLPRTSGGLYIEGSRDAYRLALKDINQLDEPEVTFEQAYDKLREGSILSEKSFDYYWNCISDNVEIDEPGNLLVPKQELPVIPKFVAEFLIGKEDYMLYELLDDEWLYKEHDRVAKWLYDNDELTNKQREIDLVMARDRGYLVEEEPKYRVIFPSVDKNGKGFNYLAKDTYHNELWIEDSRTDGLDWEERSCFTENEIRDMEKGDILFEHFAVKVEEVD